MRVRVALNQNPRFQEMSGFAPKKRGIQMPVMLAAKGKKESFDEMSSTYSSPDNAIKINAKGIRGKDGVYLNSINPENLVVMEVLGSGASAVVKRAVLRDQPSNSFVVKLFSMHEDSKRRMLREEVKLLAEISCASIVSFHGAFLDSSKKVCIILEFMDRGSLEDVFKFTKLKSAPVPENVLCAMAYQIAHGLSYLNSVGLMHRDIK